MVYVVRSQDTIADPGMGDPMIHQGHDLLPTMGNRYLDQGNMGHMDNQKAILNQAIQQEQSFANVSGGGAPPPVASANVASPISALDRGGAYYRGQVGDWYNTGLTPEGTLAEHLRYDPTLIDTSQLQTMNPYDYDPMRQEAMNQLAAQQAGGYQTALSQMAAGGGLTAADRMALASSFNRGRLGATGGMLGQLGTEEARNVWETEQANKEMLNKAYLQNLEMQNLAQEANLQALDRERLREFEIARDLYQTDIAEERFAKGVEGAEAQSAAMQQAAQPRSTMERLLDPMEIFT